MNNYIEKGIAYEDTSKHPPLWAGFFMHILVLRN